MRFLGRFVRRLAVLGVVVAVSVGAHRFGVASVVTVVVATGLGLVARTWFRRRSPSRHRALGFGVTAAFFALLAASTWSYTGYLTAPGAATTAVRTSDWMRDHGMSSLVDRLEQSLYTGHGPRNGPVAKGQLPTSAYAGAAGSTGHNPGPLAVTRLIDKTLAGEGRWTPNTRQVGGRPVTYTTFVRPDPAHTNVVAAAVWLDPQATRVTYVPGTKQPGTWAWGSGVPIKERPSLVAAFNSGWKFKDIPGGVHAEGRTPVPLVAEQASLVLHADGAADIGAWGSEVKMSSDVTSVRQNLALVVDHGGSVPGLKTSTTGEWGKRKWQLQYTNRSGLGITRNHALVYVAGSNLTTQTLADALVKVGAIRAMELDIHASNPTFNFFAPASGAGGSETGTKLLPTMTSAAGRFLAPDQRDFFAVTTTATATGTAQR